MRSFAVGERRVRVYQLDVLRQRALSQALAQALAVTHHSPQVILLDGATPVWHYGTLNSPITIGASASITPQFLANALVITET